MVAQRKRKVISQRMLEANRRNAKKSTGPRTARGKRRVSRNAITHGLTSISCPVLPFENEFEYRILADAVMRDLRPVGIVQRELVGQITQLFWKLRRIPRIEAVLLSAGMGAIEEEFEQQKEDGTLSEHADLSITTTAHLIAGQFWSTPDDRAYERLENYRMRLERGLHASLRKLEDLRDKTAGEDVPEFHQFIEAVNDAVRVKKQAAEIEEAQAELEESEKECSVTRASGPCQETPKPGEPSTGQRPASREEPAKPERRENPPEQIKPVEWRNSSQAPGMEPRT